MSKPASTDHHHHFAQTQLEDGRYAIACECGERPASTDHYFCCACHIAPGDHCDECKHLCEPASTDKKCHDCQISGRDCWHINPAISTDLDAQEVFVPVRDYEGLYEVSNTGRVRSLPGGRRKGRELKLINQNPKKGVWYSVVSLTKNGKTKSYGVHRLVAEAFIPNLDSKPCVNHKDGNKSNNNVTNLEWNTHQENLRHSFRELGRMNGRAILTKEQVAEIMVLLKTHTQAKIAEMYGVHFSTISKYKRGVVGAVATEKRIKVRGRSSDGR